MSSTICFSWDSEKQDELKGKPPFMVVHGVRGGPIERECFCKKLGIVNTLLV